MAIRILYMWKSKLKKYRCEWDKKTGKYSVVNKRKSDVRHTITNYTHIYYNIAKKHSYKPIF